MDELRKTGRVTIPTDLDVVPETLEILKKWGADAIRDCDGTDFPQQLKDADAKIYSTYYTTRKDNAWAKANPDEVQQCYIMTGFYTAPGDTVTIPLMKGISPELMQVNTNDDITRWWEVMDRTTGQPVPPEQWSYADGSVTVQAVPFHEYTVSFLAYLIWDPVHMYNATTNGWTNFEHQITFDVRQPKTHKYSMERLRKFIAEHPYVNVIRYTTFFHQFTLIFDELKRESSWTGMDTLLRSALISSTSLSRRWATSSARSTSSIRATITTSTGCPARNSGIFRPSSAARWQSLPRRWWTSPTRAGAKP